MRVVSMMCAVRLLVSLCGCQPKFTRQRYETIYIGMPAEQVRQVLGEPDATDSQCWSYLNEMPYYKAIFHFADGQVASKSWSNDRWQEASSP